MRTKDPSEVQLNGILSLFNQRDFHQVLAKARPLLKQNKKSFILNRIVGAAEAELGHFDNALICFKRMLQIDPKSAETLFFIGNVMVAKQRTDSAIKSYRLALNQKPDYFAALYNLGCTLVEIQRASDAVEPLEQAVALKPKNVGANLNLGIALHRSGELSNAESVLSCVAASNPELFEAQLNLGLIKLETKQFKSAIKAFKAAEKIKPKNPQAFYGLGASFRAESNLLEAQKFLKAAIYHQREFKAAKLQLASLVLELGNFEEAQVLYEQLLSKEPDNYLLKLQLAETYRQSKQFSPSIRILESISDIDDENYAANRKLAEIYSEIRNDQEAIKCYERILQKDQSDPKVFYNLALIFSRIGKNKDAISALDAAVKLNPEFDTAIALLEHQKKINCDWAHAKLDENKIKTLGMKESIISPFNALAIEDNALHQKIRATLYAKKAFGRHLDLSQNSKQSSSGRLKIGYFSGDIYDHPLLDLFQGVLREHDNTKFDISIYSYGPNKTGSARELAQKSVDKFFDAHSWSNSKFLDHLKNNPLDIAVDLSGYTEFSRTDILAARVAPVQISHLGYPGTTGAEFIDYLIADKTLIPHENRGFYSESIIFMPHSFQSNDNQRDLDSLPTTRFQNNLPENGVVFCCFHNSYKISEEAFNIWLRILIKVPKSVLWFGHLNPVAICNLKEIAQKQNINPDRLIFAPKLKKNQHFERLRHADLFLDTFNVNAGATASDALWNGVPVLTKAGQQFASRMAASINKAAGLDDLVTDTESAYEELAIKLAQNPTCLKKWKSHLLKNKSTLPLFDTVSYTRKFEVGLLTAYKKSVSEQKPQDIHL